MFEKIISSIGAALDERRIPYMLIGGQAVLLYGEPRLTRDIDITLGVDVNKLADVVSLAQDLQFKMLPDCIEDFVRETMVLPVLHEETGIRIDFIFSFSLYERQAIAQARKVRLTDRDVNFAAPEDVIIHKIVAGRPRDLDDVRGILLKTPDLDLAYIRTWLADFSNALEEAEIKQRLETILSTVSHLPER
ncbi:MAG: nucleotidyltransferase [Deltaproteobacteria bacterium]|nr:nucleotidyltransferase [Deltaproteobacteria bacterium]